MKGTKLVQIYLWTSINNTAPFLSIPWHQKEPLGCAVYSDCPTNDSYKKCVHVWWCLPCNYVAKPFGILQRVIKSQNVYISFRHCKSWYFFSQKRFWLNFQNSGPLMRQAIRRWHLLWKLCKALFWCKTLIKGI